VRREEEELELSSSGGGWVDLAADMGCHGLTGGEEGMDRRVALCLLYYLFLVRSRFCRFYFSSTCII
jgi:hypothetical protein